jgi:hypothetical protein
LYEYLIENSIKLYSLQALGVMYRRIRNAMIMLSIQAVQPHHHATPLVQHNTKQHSLSTQPYAGVPVPVLHTNARTLRHKLYTASWVKPALHACAALQARAALHLGEGWLCMFFCLGALLFLHCNVLRCATAGAVMQSRGLD